MGSSASSCCGGGEKVEGFMPTGNISWRIFTYKELYNATNGFSEDNKLGEGGFGSVYWGKTSDGLQVDVFYGCNLGWGRSAFWVESYKLGLVKSPNF